MNEPHGSVFLFVLHCIAVAFVGTCKDCCCPDAPQMIEELEERFPKHDEIVLSQQVSGNNSSAYARRAEHSSMNLVSRMTTVDATLRGLPTSTVAFVQKTPTSFTCLCELTVASALGCFRYCWPAVMSFSNSNI
jgi:hypothetical protein